jgi:hypothetical protein
MILARLEPDMIHFIMIWWLISYVMKQLIAVDCLWPVTWKQIIAIGHLFPVS